MAMQLVTNLNSGVSGNYWRISNMTVNRDAKVIIVQLSLYLSKAGREAGLLPASCSAFILGSADYTAAMAAPNLVQAIYDYLKAQPQFAGEVDC